MVRVIAIIQARMNSERLPGKVLKLIKEKTFIELIVRRLERSKLIDDIVFALPDNESSKPIINLLKNINIGYNLGDEHNLLSRYLGAANANNADYIIRITADCPFIDPDIIDDMIKKILSTKLDFITNVLPPSWPDGLDVNIFSMKTLLKTNKDAKLNSDKEHVVPWMWKNSNLKNKNMFKAFNFLAPMNMEKYRWTLDTKEDYDFFYETAQELSWGKLVDMTWKDFIDFYKNNDNLNLINGDNKRDEGYKTSLDKDKDDEI